MTAAGAPPDRLDDASMASLLPPRPADGHKGTFGTVVAVAGSLDYAGAALLAGTAALRAGCGIAVLAVPASLQPVVAGRVPELVTLALPERTPFEADPETAWPAIAAGRVTSLLVGPGLRVLPPTAALVEALLAAHPDEAGAPAPAVVDAGALAALAGRPGWWRTVGRPCILTPHPGELERLDGTPVPADDDGRVARARAAAARFGQTIVLKGARTVIARPDGAVAIGGGANAALASGGTGDILAGVIASLLAQGSAPWDAARLGVHLHARAARAVAARIGDAGLLASDLLGELPLARRALAAAGG